MLLYTHPLSANAHKVKLLLGYLGLPYEERDIDIPAGEQREPAFLTVSALGQIPVLEEGDLRLRDAQAILIYLGARHGGGTWWPTDPLAQGLVAQWLAFAALELQTGINLARLHFRLGAPCDLVAAQAQGEKTLALVEAHFGDGREWLELDRPTIADCACAPFIARAGEAGHDLARFPKAQTWIARLAALPGFTAMEGWGVSRARKAEAGDVNAALVTAFRRSGFAGASMRDLQAATGLGPASLYHRFAEGKGAMAGAALAHVATDFGTLVLTPLGEPGAADARLKASAGGVRRFYDDGRLACLLAVFTLSDAPEPVQGAVADAFRAWHDALNSTLEEAGVADPRAAAEDRIAAVQGALVLARATGARGAFDRAVAALERAA